MQKKINLFLLGFPRSGTTSLVTLLKQSNQVRFTSPKEPHYFCKDFHQLSKTMHGEPRCFNVRSAEQYKDALKEHASCNGDGSTSYVYSEDAARNIQEYNSEAKFIIVIRDPVHFLKSWHNYLYQRGEVKTRSLKKHLSAIKDKRLDKVINRHKLCHKVRADYLDLIDYSSHINRWYEFFSRDQIEVVFFEEFISNPQRTMDNLCTFIGIDKYLVKEEKQFNSALYVMLMHNSISRKIIDFLRVVLPGRIDKMKLLRLLKVFEYKYSTEDNNEIYQLIKKEYDQSYDSIRALCGEKVRDYWSYSTS